jgi:predicted Zn-dependent protease
LEQAEALLKECIEKEPEWPEALISMGSVKMEQGKKKTASTIYKQALTILKAREKGEVKHVRLIFATAILKLRELLRGVLTLDLFIHSMTLQRTGNVSS